MSDTNVTGEPQVIRSGNMFSTDSQDTLGVNQQLPLTAAPEVKITNK
jgi:hypothetical protein